MVGRLRKSSAPGRDANPVLAWGRLPRTHASIAALFTHVLRTGFVPQPLLRAYVAPIPKPGRTGFAAYRPISLLPSLAKILERVVLGRALASVEERLPSEQYAFRPGLSCDVFLADLGRAIGTAQDAGLHSLLVSLDIGGAHDSVRPRLLLRKVVDFGLPAWAVRWLRSWMSNRFLRVRLRTRYGACYSPDCRATCGLPQGGVLSPFLWVIFLSDFRARLAASGVDLSAVQLAIYADDITFLTSGRSAAAVTQLQEQALAATRSYFSANDLVLSSEKSKRVWTPARPRVPRAFLRRVLLLRYACTREAGPGSPSAMSAPLRPSPPAAPGVCLPLVPAVRILGVFFDGDLRSTTHVSILTARLRRRVALLRRHSSTSWGCSATFLLATYQALVQNCLAHGIVGLGSLVTEEVFLRLNVEVVHPGLRLACGVGRLHRIETLYAMSGCLSAQHLFTCRCGKLFDHASRTRGNDAAASTPGASPRGGLFLFAARAEHSRLMPPCAYSAARGSQWAWVRLERDLATHPHKHRVGPPKELTRALVRILPYTQLSVPAMLYLLPVLFGAAAACGGPITTE